MINNLFVNSSLMQDNFSSIMRS